MNAAQATDLIEIADADGRLRKAITPYDGRLRQMWGDLYPQLCLYAAVTTRPRVEQGGRLGRFLRKNPPKRTMIFIGERGSEPNQVDMPQEQFLGALEGIKAVENGNYHVLFSGGCLGLGPAYGEVPARALYDTFMQRTKGSYGDRCSFEQLSVNTGHQARNLGQMIQTGGFDALVVVMSIEHIARLMATLAFDLHQRGIHIPILAAPHGDWDDAVPFRDMTRAEECFGPIQKPGDPGVKLAMKLLGDELGKRYRTECDPTMNQNFACGALDPLQMFDLGYVQPELL